MAIVLGTDGTEEAITAAEAARDSLGGGGSIGDELRLGMGEGGEVETPGPLAGMDVVPLAPRSIPQSEGPPPGMGVFGESPWVVQEREEYAAAARKAAAAQAELDDSVLSPRTHFTPQELSFARDFESGAKTATNDLFLRLHGGDAPLPLDGVRRRLAILATSTQQFGEPLETDVALYGRIKQDAQGRRDQDELVAGRDEETARTSLAGMIMDGAVKGDDWQSTFRRWNEAVAGDSRYRADRQFDYWSYAQALHGSVSGEVEAARPFADKAFRLLIGERDQAGPYGGQPVIDAVKAAPSELRPMVLALLDRQAQAIGDSEPRGWHHLQVGGRALLGQLTGTMAHMEAGDLVDAQRILDEIKPGDEYGGRFEKLIDYARGSSSDSAEGRMLGFILEPFLKNQVATPESIAATKATLADQMANFQLSHQIAQIGNGTLSPLKADSWVGRKLSYPATEMLAPVVGAALLTKGAGGGALFSSGVATSSMFGLMADQNQQALLARHPGMSFAQSYQIATNAAYAQAGLMFAADLLTLGKAPGLEKSLQTAEAPLLRNFAKALPGAFVGQNVLGAMQELAVPLVQSLTDGAPATPWHEILLGPHGWLKQRADVALSLLPAVVMGAAGHAYQARASLPELRRVAETLRDESGLKAAGIPEAGRAPIMAESDPVQRLALFDLERRNPDPAVAREGLAELDARRAEMAAAARQAQRSGDQPVFSHSSEGIEVRNSLTGEIIGTARDADGALKLAQSHFAAVREMDANQIAHLGSMLEATHLTATTDHLVRETQVEYAPGEEATAGTEAAGSAANEQRVLEQMRAQELLGGGTGSMTDLVAGKSVTTFREGLRQTLNKLFKGATVLDVFHEEAHGFFREALATGRLKRQGVIDAIRALQDPLVGRTTREGEALHFLPPEGEVTWVQLDEAVAKVMEAEILRNRDGGTKRTVAGREGGLRGVPSAIITRNLTAAAKIAPEAVGSFASFVQAVRKYFGVTFQRALAINKAIREGKIDVAAHETFISKLLGLEEIDGPPGDRALESPHEGIQEGPAFALGSSPGGSRAKSIGEDVSKTARAASDSLPAPKGWKKYEGPPIVVVHEDGSASLRWQRNGGHEEFFADAESARAAAKERSDRIANWEAPSSPKPKYSPVPQKWLEKGGSIDQNWTYTDWEGNSVPYVDGYPDFKAAGFVLDEVKIIQRGNYTTDFNDADKKHGGPLPFEMTWHHHQDGIRMQAILTAIHSRFTHSGGMHESKKIKT